MATPLPRIPRPSAGAPASPGRRAILAAALAAGCVAALPASANSPAGVVSSHLATVEVFDRHDGVALPVYVAGGERWIVGTPGHEYSIRIRNVTAERILAVPSVDGVNAITGETAAPDQSGYVLDPWGSVEIAGWRKSLSHTAAFYFTDVADSYAARTGRPVDLGVIGVAVFREQRPIAVAPPPRIANEGESRWNAPQPYGRDAAGRAEASSAPSAAEAPGKSLDAAGSAGAMADAKRRDSRLGTGHGRGETSYAQRVTFERATRGPEAVVAIRYDRRENLVARGIVPGPRYAGRAPTPFPGWNGFAADPR